EEVLEEGFPSCREEGQEAVLQVLQVLRDLQESIVAEGRLVVVHCHRWLELREVWRRAGGE
ncbi:hypothetical protein KEM55_007118, partial [Ascosphaera atra]